MHAHDAFCQDVIRTRYLSKRNVQYLTGKSTPIYNNQKCEDAEYSDLTDEEICSDRHWHYIHRNNVGRVLAAVELE